jgi:hypothetical protein
MLRLRVAIIRYDTTGNSGPLERLAQELEIPVGELPLEEARSQARAARGES